MAWRGLHLSRPARLSTGDSQIIVSQEDGEVRLPLEDVAYVVLDTPQATLTAALLSACMACGIAIIATDARHTPSGVMLPFHVHHRQAGVAAEQIRISEPFRKRCWQRVVIAKIRNQADVLDDLCRPGADGLHAMAHLVGSGDPDNVEARAAREYWSALFSGFVRDDAMDLRNKMLNYGYAVARSGVARALVGAGLLPSVGIHHASVTNPFNLADDFVEPFRPFVDRLAAERCKGRSGDDELSLEDRRAMASVLTRDACLGGETMSLIAATEAAANAFVRAIEAGSAAALLLPSPLASKLH